MNTQYARGGTYFHGVFDQYNKSDNKFLNWIVNHPSGHILTNSTANSLSFEKYSLGSKCVPLRILDETHLINPRAYFYPKHIIGVERVSGEKNPGKMKSISKYDKSHSYLIYDAQNRPEEFIAKNYSKTSNFQILPSVTHEEYYRILNQGESILFNRATYESFGMSTAESLVAGRPVIGIWSEYNNNTHYLIEEIGDELYSTDKFKVYDSGVVLNNNLTDQEIAESINLGLNELLKYYNEGDSILGKIFSLRKKAYSAFVMNKEWIEEFIKWTR